jgi:hypothetical protein
LGRHLTVIALTGRTGVETQGFDAAFLKPVNPFELCEEVAAVLARRQA